MRRIALPCALATALLACGPERDVFIPPVCTAGATVACGCDGADGVATCSENGAGYGECDCQPVLKCDGGECATDGGSKDGGHSFCIPETTAACTCPDTREGTHRCNSSGSDYDQCVCDSPQQCSVSSLVATGTLGVGNRSINYSQTQVSASFQHYLGSGTGEGCLGVSHLRFALEGNSCAFTLDFGAVASGFGGLTQASLVVDSACSQLTGVTAGTYTGAPGYGLVGLSLSTAVPDTFTSQLCLQSEFVTFTGGAFNLTSAGGTTVLVGLSTLNMIGDLFTTGSASAACFSSSTCAPDYRSGGPAWCKSATCGSGQHDGGDGNCVPNGTCSSGFHDGGSGTCVEIGSCTTGFHDGGDGACRQNGTCSSGYHDGGRGICVEVGFCDFGYHDGGNGSCVTEGSCSANYLPDTEGVCIPAGDCTNAPAVARAGSDRSVNIGSTVTLNGSASSGAPALSYLWELVSKPGASNTFLSAITGVSVTLAPDVAGDYVVELSVTDSRLCSSSPALVTIHAAEGSSSVSVRVTWDSDHGDVDLHFLAPGGTFKSSTLDCYYANETPDWGPGGADLVTENDPVFGGDTRWGGATGEHIDQQQTFDGVFTPEVHYFCDSQNGGVSQGSVTATMHVEVDGTEIATFSRTLTKGMVWPAATITVTNGGTHVVATQSSLGTFTIAGCN